ncbi:MAG: family 10 glycosylhydrolase [Armatimonadota bacterium]|nr:family 10 glycosylhydrolase [bacterium]
MLKCLIALIALVACSAQAAESIDYTRIDPIVEVRAIWVNADAIPKTDKAIRELVRSYHNANINVLFPEVIARGYAAYPTRLLARDPRFTGAVDPLPPMIDEAHKLGMEVHPWVWVFRAGYTKDRGAILTAHPDWVMLGKYGEDLSANGGLWISPAIPEARDFLACLFAELVSKYDVDGLHLDYIRYEVQSPIPYGYDQTSRCAFKQQYGIDPIDIQRLSINQILWNKFRERLVNSFVQRISAQTRAIKPNLKISAAVGSDPTTARLNLLQNWPNWVDNKWVDFLTPMAYTSNDATFTQLVTNQLQAVGHKTIIVPGIGLHMQKNKPDQTIAQIGIARELDAGGQALFASAYYSDPLALMLKCEPYSSPALLPFRDPACKSALLCNCAEKSTDAASQAYFAARSTALADYAAYQSGSIGYVAPTDPPLDIPENIIPLPTVDIPKTASPVNVDGDLNDSAWQSAAKVALAYTNDGAPASVETTALLTYDDDNLYVAFQAVEPNMDKLKATVTKRDGPTFYDDSVEVFIDPADMRRAYYHLSTNTLGTRFDQKVFDTNWNGEWLSAAQTNSAGYTVEMAIPFSIFGISTPAHGTKMALNLTRNRTTSGSMEYLTWAVLYGGFHNPDRFGTAILD